MYVKGKHLGIEHSHLGLEEWALIRRGFMVGLEGSKRQASRIRVGTSNLGMRLSKWWRWRGMMEG